MVAGPPANPTIYEIRARHWNQRGVAGDWSAILEHTVSGDLTPTGPVTGLVVTPEPGGFLAKWNNPTDADFANCCIYVGTAQLFAVAELIATIATDFFLASGLTAGQQINVWVRAKDTSGNLSAVQGPVTVTPTEPGGSVVHDIGSANFPSPSLGKVGDTAINDESLYFFKAATGWVLRGDLGDAQVYFRATMPPPNSFGEDNDIAIGPNNRLMRRVAGVWVDIALIIPTPAGLTATVTALHLGRLASGGFHSYDLDVAWTDPGGYLVEIDIGSAPTSLQGADSVWGGTELQTSATTEHEFKRLSSVLTPTAAVRIRNRGAFGQHSPWTYIYFNFGGTANEPLISIVPRESATGQGESAGVYCWVANATTATLAEVDGSNSQSLGLTAPPYGSAFVSLSVMPTDAGTNYRLTATNLAGTVTADARVEVFARPDGAQPPSEELAITSFLADLLSIAPGNTTTLRWIIANADSASINQGSRSN